MVLEAGKALVIAFNKWDLMDEDRRYYLDREIDEQLRHHLELQHQYSLAYGMSGLV